MKTSLYKKLTDREFKLLHYIIHVNNEFSTREYAEEIVGSMPRNIRNALRQLKEYGIIEIVRSGNKRKYLLNSQEDWQV